VTETHMKIGFAILVACLLVLALTGCNKVGPDGPDDPANGRVEYFTDTTTGCQYILWDGASYAGGIAPRMGKDGKQVCT
jgi:predicted small lipoprotein YifL